MTENELALLEAGRFYVGCGLSVIPIAPTGAKRPACEWKEFQERRATDDELRRWLASGRNGVAIVGGGISGNLEIIDIDEPELVEPFTKLAVSHVPKLADAPLVTTPGDGAHLYSRCAERVSGNMKLAMRLGGGSSPSESGGGITCSPP
jgi:Bifunctional DNA primase/polymerase, N-terminal